MDKPFKTINEQIAILEARGMEVGASAYEALSREGYYSVVNGYKDLFLDARQSREKGGDVYKEGTRFDDLYRVFEFDRDLRLVMFRYFSMAEAVLKTVCSYNFTQVHVNEKEPYLDRRNYRSDRGYPERVDRLIRDFKSALGKDPRKPPRRKAYLDHYRDNHDEVPLWVLLRYMTLGQTFKFFEFQNDSMRNAMAKNFSELYARTYGCPKKIYDRDIRLAFDHIKDFRNICAHDERLYCARVSPSHSVSVWDVASDLGLVLPRDEHARMLKEIESLLRGVLESLDGEACLGIVSSMGVDLRGGAFS